MTALREHRLEGLEPDNLLAFLALLGLLRALETSDELHPERRRRRPRVRWSRADGSSLKPVVALSAFVSIQDVVADAVEGIQFWGGALRALGQSALEPERQRLARELNDLQAMDHPTNKQREEIKKIAAKLRKRSSDAAEEKLADFVGSFSGLKLVAEMQSKANDVEGLASAAALTSQYVDKEGRLDVGSTPLKFSSGQQPFAGTLISLCTGVDAPSIIKSLTAPWTYKHRGDSLRMSPVEARWYALSASDPTEKEPKRKGDEVSGSGTAPSELGANMLAALGLMSFPVAPGPTAAVAGWQQSRGEARMRWPIYQPHDDTSVSLAQLEAILQANHEDSDVTWFEARVFYLNPDLPTSKYKNVSFGEVRQRVG